MTTIDLINDYMTVADAAETLSITPTYTRLLIKSGDLQAVKMGRAYLLSRESVRQYEAAHLSMPDGHIAPGEAAATVGVSRQTILNWIRSGYLPAIALRAGKRNRWAIPTEALEGKFKHKPFQSREAQDNTPQPPDNTPQQLSLDI